MKKISIFFKQNEKWLTPTALIGGFILDNLTLRQVDAVFENIFLTVYFVLVMGGLLVWHSIQTKVQKSVSLVEFQSILFLFVQFLFGGLFSALTVFYIKSASLFASWPFLFILFGGMIATEYFKKHFNQFLFQITTLYFLLFTYSIVIIPLFLRSIGTWIFIISAIISLCLIFAYLLLFKKITPALFDHTEKKIIAAIGSVFLLMNIFYFTNIIPPIPLALKDSGVYKSVTRVGSDYNFSYFNSSFSFTQFKREYQVVPGTPVYFYSSVFAPVRFTQSIVHEWQRKNTQGDWIAVSNVNFQIQGGNRNGYRGYTISSQVTKGEWRVLVKTKNGQVLGGETFMVK
jgi:hypothetical protein